MWVLPFLHDRHQYPLTTFEQEWWSALLGVFALTALLARDYWQQAQIPRIVQLPAALIAVVCLQYAVGRIDYPDQALLYVLYLLLALLLMMLGGWLRDCFGIEKFALILAIFLVIGAESGALIGVLQHFRWHTFLDSVIVNRVGASVYGNLAQPNHFADYIALGLISLGLLHEQRKLPTALLVALVIPLLFVMTLSGSRSSWLYLIMMAALAWWGLRRQPQMRSLLVYSLLLLAGFVLMQGIVQLPFLAGGNDVNTLQRVMGDNASGGIRLYLWHESWLMFKQSPWLGMGMGQFAWQHFQLAPLLHRPDISGLYNNAHSLIFQLAAETGIAGLTALIISLGLWITGLPGARHSNAHWWGYAVLGVLAIHSMLEYPLWYAYFLAIAAILLGALDESRYRLGWGAVPRMLFATMLLLGMLSLIQLRTTYRQLKFELALPGAADFERNAPGKLGSAAPFSSYDDFFMSSHIKVNDDRLAAKLALNSRALRFIPIGQVAYRQAFLLAQSGRIEQAKLVFGQAFWSYPFDADMRQQLVKLADKDPAHFAALLEFALKTEQEYVSAIHNK